jgi:carboxyl-terminal processing protease
VINDFALEYVNKNRTQLKYSSAKEFNQQFKVNTPLINELKSYANKNDIKSSASDLGKGLDLLSTHLKAYIAKDIFNQEAWFFVKNANDDACKKALLMLSKQKN